MIITKQKGIDEIFSALRGAKSVFIVGCGDCAALCRTGGRSEIEKMTEILKSHDVLVTGSALPHSTCHELDVQRILRANKEAVEKSDAILVLACGAGTQAVGDSIKKPAVSGCDSLFIGNSKRQMHFYEKCSVCGDCVLNETGGLCPETRCPKGMQNGPCGGAVRGNCEVDHARPCVWIEIYDRLKEFGRLDDLKKLVKPKNRKVATKPHRIEKE
ncbi:MAG: methylenetetrahydrofolate reductase C-terminal domain-containing protein [Nitrospinae bacterium]|nr:methylenetetrahydrofolate reductase C-terminal domain-containing protein [Nitrospinota bacterium]